MKLHRRRVVLDGREHTVVTLRPGTRARFSTNRFHGTWHILSDQHGAAVLARLLWGLSFQRRPGTLVVVDRLFLDPNPFDAENSDPIVLSCPTLTPLTPSVVRDLRRRLARATPPDGTVRWHTPGLDPAVAGAREYAAAGRDRDLWAYRPKLPRGSARVERINGMLALIAPPRALREWAVRTARLGDWSCDGMDYTELDVPGFTYEGGEVQIFHDYHRRVSAARVARREVVARDGGDPPPAELAPRIWDHLGAVRARGTRIDS